MSYAYLSFSLWGENEVNNESYKLRVVRDSLIQFRNDILEIRPAPSSKRLCFALFCFIENMLIRQSYPDVIM